MGFYFWSLYPVGYYVKHRKQWAFPKETSASDGSILKGPENRMEYKNGYFENDETQLTIFLRTIDQILTIFCLQKFSWQIVLVFLPIF